MPESNLQFPFKRSLNLLKLVDFWREAANDESTVLSAHAEKIMEELENRPELLAYELDPEVVKDHLDLIPYLMTPLIPLGGSVKVYSAAIPPFETTAFYTTDCFDELQIGPDYLDNLRIPGYVVTAELLELGRLVDAYAIILKTLTGLGGNWNLPFVYTTKPDEQGLRRHFKMEFDPRFVELKVHGKAPKIKPEDIERIQHQPLNLSLWQAIIPADKFEFSGFTVINATEVTIPEELSMLKDDLLRSGSMATSADIDHLQGRLRTILRRPDIQLGLLAVEHSGTGEIEGARPVGRSLLMSDNTLPPCDNKDDSFYLQALHREEPVIVSDLDACGQACTEFEYHVMGLGCRNLVLAPLHVDGRPVGLLELASPNPGDINSWNIHNVIQVRGLFATAINRDIEEREDRIQSVIKRRYTAIHPSVEWRFRKVAQQFVDMEIADAGRPDVGELVFENVFPLYGLSDIRGSSTHRVEAIKEDLIAQLAMAHAVVKAARKVKSMPALDELAYQIEKYSRQIRAGLSSGDEVSVLDFLKDEVESRLDHLQTFDADTRKTVDAYRSALDPSLGVLYEKRKAFEDSVHTINERIAAYLDVEQERAQAMFPHYFERYLTDGVDYNIYVGASLVPDGVFDPIYLRNLRLWQLMLTCGVVWQMEEIKPGLPEYLDTAHLILVQSAPLAVRFRDDERKFDVDGAYNARYEIVKKRIDKAVVKSTGERLTQPGMIAIVYAQTKEAEEYERYIDYLLAAGYLTGDVEYLDLEDLQGVSGLKALRVKVAKTSPDVELAITPTGAVEAVESR